MQNDCVGKCVTGKQYSLSCVEEDCWTSTIDMCDAGTV